MMNSFVTGQAAQGFMWPGGFSTILDPAKSVVAHDLGWAPTPEVVMLGGWAVSVNAQAHSPEAAKLFVGWLTSKEVSRRLALLTAQPCRISVFRDAEMVARYPHLPGVLEGMQGKVAAYVPIKESEQINIMIYDEANAACAGTKKPEQAAADLQDKVTAFMKRRGYLHG
jgi:ABC-type glycerol-3-phosphate transport system substrate-binding protein